MIKTMRNTGMIRLLSFHPIYALKATRLAMESFKLFSVRYWRIGLKKIFFFNQFARR